MAPAPRLRQAVFVAALLLVLSTTTMCGAGTAQDVSVPPSAATATATAATPAPPTPTELDAACLSSLLNMSDCLPFVQLSSATARPPACCCLELAGTVGSNPSCLCVLLSAAADAYGIAINNSRALALPGLCRVATPPPVSTCAALGYNVTGMAPSVAPMSRTTWSAAPHAHGKADRRYTASGDLIALAAAFATILMMF
jgi:hypothetical protein